MASRTSHHPRQRSELRQALHACRGPFLVVGLFSLVINLLLLVPSIYMLQVYDRVLTTGRIETLVMLTLLVAISLLAMCVLEALRTMITIRIGVWLNGCVGPVIIERSVRAKIKGETSGAQPMRDLTQVQSFIATNGLAFFFDGPWVPIFLLLIWLLHPLLGAVAATAAVILLGLTLLNDLMTRKSTIKANQDQIAATQQIDGAVRNAEVVHAMGMLPAVVASWRQHHGAGMIELLRGAQIGGVLQSITKFIRFFVQSGVLGLGAYLAVKGELSPGAMIAASILLGRGLAPVEMAMQAWRNLVMTRAAVGRIDALLLSVPPEPRRTLLPFPSGRLTVDKLTYVVPGSGKPILKNVSFAVAPGEAVAIIGPSAAGKSSLCRFLVGIAQPTAGSVRLDGAELVHWDRGQLGACVGYLPQDVELFSGTVRSNIARMAGNADDDAVVSAAMLAQAHDMIIGLPNGYETEIGDAGTRLSGGQRQRVGLARAVFGRPRLLVLDEPNANLDTAGESALAAAIGELKANGAALVIVGHRPSTLAQADKLMLLRDGQIELFGPREEVLHALREATAKSRARELRRNTTGSLDEVHEAAHDTNRELATP
jgi:PrtD family type I secretion system ABC transporter